MEISPFPLSRSAAHLLVCSCACSLSIAEMAVYPARNFLNKLPINGLPGMSSLRVNIRASAPVDRISSTSPGSSFMREYGVISVRMPRDSKSEARNPNVLSSSGSIRRRTRFHPTLIDPLVFDHCASISLSLRNSCRRSFPRRNSLQPFFLMLHPFSRGPREGSSLPASL